MSSESINHKLERVRKPRVHIKYEVETESGVVEKELPFTVGVLGDFSGNSPAKEKKTLKERKFINTDKDNFNSVMENMAPGLSIRVENTLKDNASEIPINLSFSKIEDFEPAQIVSQIPALRDLMDARNKLCDLLTKSDRSDALESILEKTLQDDHAIDALAMDLGLEINQSTENKESIDD